MPSLPVRFASGFSALRSARALPDTLPLVGVLPGGQRTGVANALAVGVYDADTCWPPVSPGPLRRPLKEAPTARIFIVSIPGELFATFEFSPGPRSKTRRIPYQAWWLLRTLALLPRPGT